MCRDRKFSSEHPENPSFVWMPRTEVERYQVRPKSSLLPWNIVEEKLIVAPVAGGSLWEEQVEAV